MLYIYTTVKKFGISKIFLQYIYKCIKEGCIELIKGGSKDIYVAKMFNKCC